MSLKPYFDPSLLRALEKGEGLRKVKSTWRDRGHHWVKADTPDWHLAVGWVLLGNLEAFGGSRL